MRSAGRNTFPLNVFNRVPSNFSPPARIAIRSTAERHERLLTSVPKDTKTFQTTRARRVSRVDLETLLTCYDANPQRVRDLTPLRIASARKISLTFYKAQSVRCAMQSSSDLHGPPDLRGSL